MLDTETKGVPPKLNLGNLTSPQAKEARSWFRKGCGIVMVRSGGEENNIFKFISQQENLLEAEGRAFSRAFQGSIADNAFSGTEALDYIGKILKKIPEIPIAEEKVYIQAVLATYFITALRYLAYSAVPGERWWSWRDKIVGSMDGETLQAYEMSGLEKFRPVDFNNELLEGTAEDFSEELAKRSSYTPYHAFEQWKKLVFLATHKGE